MSRHLDINWLFYHYYNDNPELRRIVMTHSAQVAKKALKICRDKHLPLDHKDVYCAAMLHDIGVVKCKAPGIHAKGQLPYICHGIEGKKILEKHGLNRFANVCANHTGAGLSIKNIKENNWPLPQKNMIPKNLLEKLICYADKFFSKSGNLEREKPIEEVLAQMEHFGTDSLKRFNDLHKLFS